LLPGLVYGPGDPGPLAGLFAQYLRGKLSVIPTGTSYCWSHVEDAARAHLAAMAKGSPGEAYIVAGNPHTLRQALQMAEVVTGIPAPRFDSSPTMLRALGAVKGVVGRLRQAPDDEVAEWLRIHAGATCLGSSKKAARAFSFHERPLDEGLRETLIEDMRALGMTPRG
jgi:nucleoside-diphosphate-sugar epimerase